MTNKNNFNIIGEWGKNRTNAEKNPLNIPFANDKSSSGVVLDEQ